MCQTCGCSPEHDHDHHDNGHHHEHHHAPVAGRGVVLPLEQRVLERNDRLAADNRRWLRARRLVALYLMAEPGAGQTTLLERMIRDVGAELDITVIEGDQATDNDAARVRAAGARALQINTGAGCHLDAAMVAGGVSELQPRDGSVLVTENVGNLVCPAMFDLGEHAKVVIASVTDGDDKPQKYPHIFRAADVMLINKIDLLPHVVFDVDRCRARAREVNPRLQCFQVSATRGDGLPEWYEWLRGARAGFRQAAAAAT